MLDPTNLFNTIYDKIEPWAFSEDACNEATMEIFGIFVKLGLTDPGEAH